MNKRALRTLEFGKVLEKLAEQTTYSLGKKYALSLLPEADEELVNRRQEETKEAFTLLDETGHIALGGLHDLSDILKRVEKGGVLFAHDLSLLKDTLLRVEELQKDMQEIGLRIPLLREKITGISDFSSLRKELKRCITESGELSDDASPLLRQLRERIRVLQNRVRERLDSIVKSSGNQQYLQEAIVTLRQGRYVIPVKQEYKGRFPGLVHDSSASGATLFIEPMEVVQINNDLRELQRKEEDEVERVLRELSSLVYGEIDLLEDANERLGQFDLILAKGRLAHNMKAVRPRTFKEKLIDLKEAKHPLLKGEVVPVDIYLGEDYQIMVITGPNTGGKTVTLKTAGLFALMHQAGLHVPAKEASLPVFNNVFVDIGDEQSIEQSLSTFSGHMANIVNIIGTVDEYSLVLLDEVGAGTDPDEGAALAMAILSYFQERSILTIATTHYSELKMFAYQKEGIRNASVEFDVETLRPTYRLQIGIPGKSNALEIARRLGLEDGLLDRAASFLKKDVKDIEQMIGEMSKESYRLRLEREATTDSLIELEKLKAEYVRKLELLEEKERKLKDKAYEESYQLVAKVKREAEELINDLKEAQKSEHKEKSIQHARDKLKEMQNKVLENVEEPNEEPIEVSVGDLVYVKTLRQEGEVISLDGNDALVQIGAMKSKVPLVMLQRLSGKKNVKRERAKGISISRAASVPSEIHLRGMTVDEALMSLDKYLDDAILAGLNEVRIVHGKGTGTLRQAIGEFLRTHKFVEEYYLAPPQAGGHGVTIVRIGK